MSEWKLVAKWRKEAAKYDHGHPDYGGDASKNVRCPLLPNSKRKPAKGKP